VPRRAKIRPDEPGREKLLVAGRVLFGTQGFDATTIADIGARAGIAKSVLYHYFGSKAGLYRAVIEDDGQALIDAVASAVPPHGDSTPRLRPGVDAFLRFLAEHPDTWRMMTRDPPHDPALRRLHERVSEDVAAALRGLLAHPRKAAGKPELVELVALAVRTYATWWQSHPEVPRSEIVEAIGDLAAAGARRIGASAERPRSSGERL
jgi:AcrR family transcriptional regulator